MVGKNQLWITYRIFNKQMQQDFAVSSSFFVDNVFSNRNSNILVKHIMANSNNKTNNVKVKFEKNISMLEIQKDS